MKKISDLIKCNFDIDIFGVTDDSRNVKEGFLFVATKGYNEDHFDYIDDAINNGFTGMTNNKADYFGTKIQYISLDEFNELPDFKVNDEIDINLVKYNGEITKSKGNIETICINDGKTYLSIKYKANGIIRYSYLIEAKLKEKEEKPVVNDNKNKGCSGSIVTTSIVLSSVSLIGLLVLLLNKKSKKLK